MRTFLKSDDVSIQPVSFSLCGSVCSAALFPGLPDDRCWTKINYYNVRPLALSCMIITASNLLYQMS